jgi:hypothetical protein
MSKLNLAETLVLCHTYGHTRGAVIHELKSSYQDLPNSPDYNEDMVKRALED